MDKQTVLITGGYGCIGAETAKWILRNSNAAVVVCSRNVNSDRTNRVFHDVDQTRLTAIEADVCDQKLLEQILVEQKITSVVHMAALQTPDCNAHRDLGLQINLAGTQNLIEARRFHLFVISITSRSRQLSQMHRIFLSSKRSASLWKSSEIKSNATG